MALVDVSKTGKLDIPHEPGEWIEVRPLLASEMDAARDARLKRLMGVWAGGEIPKTPRGDERDEREETAETRASAYNPETLLGYAVVGWSYDHVFTPGVQEHIELLDAATRDWLHQELVERNTRPLDSGKSSNGHSKSDSALPNSDTAMISGQPE